MVEKDIQRLFVCYFVAVEKYRNRWDAKAVLCCMARRAALLRYGLCK